MLTKDDVFEVAKTVQDPELQIDIFTLGLVYNVDVKTIDSVDIRMTFTSPMCPFGPMIVDEFKGKLAQKGFKSVNVEIVFEPLWQPSEELRMMLGV